MEVYKSEIVKAIKEKGYLRTKEKCVSQFAIIRGRSII
jgi:hypothetical protein